MPATATGLKDLCQSMVLIREAEQTGLRLSQKRMPGFIHSYIGEETVTVGVCAPLRPDAPLPADGTPHDLRNADVLPGPRTRTRLS
jgi:TPP-dependent pyruvate/acetoin dehydrogenase alpha subunit